MLAGAAAASATTITSFTFDQLVIGVNNSPAPAVGSGTASMIGLTNNFTANPSIATGDILNAGASSGGGFAWRIRGNGASPNNGNGWAAAAPLHSQGSEYLVSTVGFDNIVLTYDWQPTTQGVKHQQVLYTINGTDWTTIGPIVVGPASESWITGITVDFSSIPAVNDNPLFGVRIVSTYAPDGPNAGQYVNLAGSPINSTSGNWRMDGITISGTAIPEPAALSILTLGSTLLLRRRK